MHGRKKSDQPRSETELTNLQRKTEVYSRTVEDVLRRKIAGDYSSTSLDLTGKILKSNPDFYSVWNFRKEILKSMNPDLSACDPSQRQRIVNNNVRDRELKLSEDCIRKNPKSYGAWHHRQWVLERVETDYASELGLCSLFLTEDQRNFHCWCYRRLVVQIGGVQAEDEFLFSLKKIEENFSNYSAFHHRSVYIQKLGRTPREIRDMVEEEFHIIESAIYTEPDDQSAWWYHQFLFTWISGQQWDDQQWVRRMLDTQIGVMRELLQIEARSKWAMSSLSMMLEFVLKLLCATGGEEEAQEEAVETLDRDRQALLDRLCEVDPYHVNRYRYLQRRKYSRSAA